MTLSPAIGEVVVALRSALTDDLPRTRISATLPLAWIHHPLMEQVLREGFRGERDGNVKAYMLTYAVNFSSPAAKELLHMALQDSNIVVRQTADYLESVR